MTWALISSSPSSNTWNRPTGPAPMTTASVSITPRSGAIAMNALLDQFRQLAGLVFPLVGIGRRRFALDHVLLVARHVFFRHDRVDRALGNAHRAIDAFVGIDGQEVRTFAEAIDGTYVNAVGIFAADAGFGNDVGHGSGLLVRWGWNSR